MSINRRFFLQTSLFLGSGALGLFPKNRAEALDFLSNDLFSQGPIQLLNQYAGTSTMMGDHDMAAHEVFWDKDGFLKKHGGLPAPSKAYDTVIIGSGISGLTSAYQRRGEKVLLLEGHPQMGGNSKAEKFQNLSMSLGAAYINVPSAGDPLDLFLKELGVSKHLRREEEKDFTVQCKGELMKDFWNYGEEFRRVRDRFLDLYENDYPELPVYPEYDVSKRAGLNAMDKLTFAQWAKQEIGETDPRITEFFHQYCWSSFGGEPDELSAAQVAGFISSDLHGTQALPGGNAVIADAIYQRLKTSKVEMINGSFAVNVKNLGGSAEVTYFEDDKRLITVTAKKVIVAAPKLVAKHLVEDLPAKQYEAMRSLRYRAYLVANILLKKQVPSIGYDVYALHGKIPYSAKRDIDERGFCDIVFADWANNDQSHKSALTLYIPQPYDGAQQFLFSAGAFEKHKGRILKNLTPWLKNLSITENDIEGFRMSRVGHGIPVAKAGRIADGSFELAHQDFGPISFVHSDNWGNPCLETAFYCAQQ